MKRAVWLALTLLGCDDPCRPTTSRAPNVRCRETDAGAEVYPNVYFNLVTASATRCTGSVIDGGLELLADIVSCNEPDAHSVVRPACELTPPIPPGRYPLSEGALVVPADGGAFECEE